MKYDKLIEFLNWFRPGYVHRKTLEKLVKKYEELVLALKDSIEKHKTVIDTQNKLIESYKKHIALLQSIEK